MPILRPYHLSDKRRGFTLIELLIVMAILGILAVLGVGNFQTARLKARDAKRKSDLATIAKSLEAYANDHRQYPLSDGNGYIICQSPGITCEWGEPFSDGTSLYTATLPVDDHAERDYRYSSNSGSNYTLYAALENPNDPSIETIPGPVDCGGTDCNYQVKSSNLP